MGSPVNDVRLRRMVREHEQALRNYCLRRLPADDAADALGEIFLVAWRRIDDIPGGDDTRPWLFGVARNVVRNALRTNRRVLRLRSKTAGLREPSAPGPETVIVRRSEHQLVIDALESLRPDDREILQLHVWDGLSRSEIAKTMSLSDNAVGMRLTRAKRRLAKQLTQLGIDSESSTTRPRAVGEGGAS